MSATPRTCAAVCALLLAAAASALAQGTDARLPQYEIRDLGTLGGPEAAALDINELGGIVGWSDREDGARVGFRLDPGLPMFQLAYFGDGAATALSNYPEEACGWSTHYLTGNRRAVYFIFDLIVEIGAPGGEPSQANDVNDNGLVVGWLDETGFVRRAWTWSGSTGFAFLPPLGNGPGEAHAVNEAGQVVGVSELYDAGMRAVRWSGGQVLDLGTLGGVNSSASGINNLGQVVGQSETARMTTHAFLWLPAPAYGRPAGMHDLGVLRGFARSEACEINDRGRVVGRLVGRAGDEGREIERAFVWDAGFGMRDLNDMIVTDEDWVLLAATAINNAGRIVGYGLHAGVLRAFELTPVGG